MKIEIEIISQKEAKLTIDGKELSIDVATAQTELNGIKFLATLNTLGGMMAICFYDTNKIMTAEHVADEYYEEANKWVQVAKDQVDFISQYLV